MHANQSIQVECDKKLEIKYLHAIINDIIRKDLDNKNSKHSGDHHLYRNNSEHALLNSNDEYFNSNRNFSSVNAEDPVTIPSSTKNTYKQSSYIQSSPRTNKFTYNVNVNQLQSVIDIKLTSNEKTYVDKTTFCRPVLHLYNEEFIFKTMERNARLKKLVKKLAIARQREKVKVTWNNFINELKNKHGINNSRSSCSIHDNIPENITPEIFKDYYNTNFLFKRQSRLCENLLEDFYDSYGTSQPNYTYYRQLNDSKIIKLSKNYKFVKYGENLYCYPTSSLGRLIMMDKEQRRQQDLYNWGKHVSDRNLYSGGRGSDFSKEKFKLKTNFVKTSAVQTDFKPIPDFISNLYKDKATNSTRESETNWSVKQEPEKVSKQNSLENIQNKLGTLIESINTFIEEIRLNKKLMKDNTRRDTAKELNVNINDSVVPAKAKKVPRVDIGTCGTLVNMSGLNPNALCTVSKVSDIVPNIGKATKINSHSYQVSIEEPTRDNSTEITKSILKYNDNDVYKNEIVEEINTLNRNQFPYQQNMTIAVNTDPLSVLALLRVSIDTFKSIISYVIPNLNCYSYLSLLRISHSLYTAEPHYVCKICGADFSKPSELSDHIPEHNLGKTRNCCVCRGVLDRVRRKQSLFSCKYCGQCFARAYCCELHQNSCAKLKAREYDVSSDLLLLK